MKDLKQRLHDYSKQYHPPISDDLFLAKCRIEELEEQHYQIMLEICGGEDAPGYAASLGLEDVKSVTADNRKWGASNRDEIERLQDRLSRNMEQLNNASSALNKASAELEKLQPIPCDACEGSGAWADPYDGQFDKCPHCNGKGNHPSEYVMVPRKPTEAMSIAGYAADTQAGAPIQAYKAMIKAAEAEA